MCTSAFTEDKSHELRELLNWVPENLPIFGERRKCGDPNSLASSLSQATYDEVAIYYGVHGVNEESNEIYKISYLGRASND